MDFNKSLDENVVKSISLLAEDTLGTETKDNLTYWKKGQKLIELPVCKEPLRCLSLQSVVDYCLDNSLTNDKRITIECGSKIVMVFGEMNKYKQRDFLLKAEYDGFNFNFGNWYSQEDFVIALLSQFEHTEDRATVLGYSSNIEDSNIAISSDDMVSQSITVKVSAANVEKVKVPNPVKLKPKRTFTEIEQEETQFIFRMKKMQDTIVFALFQADGGQWKIKVTEKIKKFITDGIELPEGKVGDKVKLNVLVL